SQLKTTNDAVATNTTNIATNTTNISNLTETVTNLGEDALKWDKDNGVFTAAHGNNTASKITNILDGTVTATSSDAINGSQLYDLSSNITLGGGNGGTTRISNVSAGVNNNDAVNYAQLKQSVQETKQYTDQRMVELDNKLSKTESKLSGGIASAMAMTGLPQAYTPGASMASIGGGTYNGESAVALGVSMVSANGRWVYKLQGSTNSQGEYSAALGAGIQW
ncbi:TPA: YadA-like family protein, partial [Escherichia coli]|nr:YadA-like family protein [Escherichia coli]